MATHSSVLAWRIPGTGEPGGLPSLGSHRVGHDRSDLAATAYNFPTAFILILSLELLKCPVRSTGQESLVPIFTDKLGRASKCLDTTRFSHSWLCALFQSHHCLQYGTSAEKSILRNHPFCLPIPMFVLRISKFFCMFYFRCSEVSAYFSALFKMNKS